MHYRSISTCSVFNNCDSAIIHYLSVYLLLRKFKMKKLVSIGSIMMALAVIIGAFGAHALKPLMSVTQNQTFETGVKYHFYHALGILIIGILYNTIQHKNLIRAAYLMLLGIILFSFSLYLLALKQSLGIGHWTFLGPITPMGGVCFIAAWLLVCWTVVTSKNE